ncbi:MAG: ACP S-malonyltransferase [Calditrichaeota bacterium]|nr:ACP S-malonyltransferase [Calditrichota bacterium]
MSNTAFLFPGQGSQFVGMAKDLYEQFADAKKIFDLAEDILEFPLKRLCFEGPEDELKQTKFTQPAIFTHSIAVDKLLKDKGLQPKATAGHSLGEYSALVSAGALSFEDGLRLVKIRGALMQIAGEKNPGTMAAIIGGTPEAVTEACNEASAAGVVQPANFNSPGQIVISGSIPGVHKAMEIAKTKGARMAKELVVSGAFHSPLMADALSGLIEALEKVTINNPKIPVYSNVEATPATDAAHIRKLLQQQLTAPVLWETIAQNMISDGFAPFYEVGPGKVLQGLHKRINREASCEAYGTADEIAGFSI